jgi:hypothetical protein
MTENLGNVDLVLQAYNAKVTRTTDTFNRVLMEALQVATQPGANLVAAAQTVQKCQHEMVRANVNQAVHQGKVARQHITMSFHEGQVDEIQGEINSLV